MHLIRKDQCVILADHGVQSLEFSHGEAAARRIPGVAQDDQASAVLQGFLNGDQVERPGVLGSIRIGVVEGRNLDDVTAVFSGDGEEGHVGRSGNDHRGTGPGKGVDGDAQGSEDRRGQGDPPRLDGPTVAAVFKLNQRLLDGLARPGRRVAEKPLLNSLLEACFHGGGGAEVHFRNPSPQG